MYKLVMSPSSFGLFLPIFSVMMPASLLRKRTKTSPKYEQTEATYFFIITKANFHIDFFLNELIIDMQKKNILSLNHEEARAFFLSTESYHGFELPEYFEFDEILQFVYRRMAHRRYEDCLASGLKPD